MKEIIFKNGLKTIVDDCDYELLNSKKWHSFKSLKGNTEYAANTEKNRTVFMHRLIMGIDKLSKDVLVDHINGNGLDNRRCNLRLCNRSENMRNRKSAKVSTSKYLGVSKWFCKSKKGDMIYWRVSIKKDGKIYFGGVFPFTKEGELLAAIKRDELAFEFHKNFAKLNFATPSEILEAKPELWNKIKPC